MSNVAGLIPDASVKIAGVEVGRVKAITLEDHKARLALLIRPDVKVRSDFTAVLRSTGLLGEKYLELAPSTTATPYVEEGGEIMRAEVYADMDQVLTVLSRVAEDIKEVTETLSNVLGGPQGEATLRSIVTNIDKITERTNSILARNEEGFSRTVENFEALSSALKEVSSNLNSMIAENRVNVKDGIDNLKNASLKLERAMETLQSLSEEVGPDIKETVASLRNVTKKIDTGEGTIGKLINDPSTHDKLDKTLGGINSYIERAERFRMYLGYRGEYLRDPSDLKSYFSLRIQPKADKYYLFEVIDDPRGKVSTKEVAIVPGTTTEITTTSDEIKFSAQFAKKIKGLTLRGGIIESSGGFGVDYHLFKDRVKLTFDAFDFDNERRPHLKAGATFNLNRHFYLVAGYDDFISKVGLESAYFGVGFQFEDEDLKYLLSAAPPVSF
jgi:phospholipid/cholesterol/gamma-HCH transport system substrate-binding protein